MFFNEVESIAPFKSFWFTELINNIILNNADNVVWFVFFVAFAFFFIYSLILIYHWFKYGAGSFIIWLAMIVYFSISLALISAMYFSAIIIS
ncbi:hypothetical protein COT82_01485 [Candidatus Campbellbacteria bacterium CG10_big_fil_rev_8_21_14_0_10_35_52]|uniref:Uncharacterized protein n=1 Tax=Candidatus Campbellbacteria bacterium CG10_big_fil_rev_8_21_14_0_10_35_52 TaxID=1974527 RepID=A0A2M6WVB7_9BACT|nr:MAG: hypothetical protein COT82_01485 [Candidatus Campbellbacteria bacterium CG10_big_fil_rev_8_21_14_0_10_35_52]